MLLADAEQVARLHAASWHRTYRGILRDDYLDRDVRQDLLSLWTERLTTPPGAQFARVADDAGVIRGFACSSGAEDRMWGTLLDNLHVAHDSKRLGIGAALVRDAAAWCDERYPGTGLYLWVYEANTEAQRFYQRLGGAEVGREVKENPGGGSAVTLRYAWRSLAPLLAHDRADDAPAS